MSLDTQPFKNFGTRVDASIHKAFACKYPSNNIYTVVEEWIHGYFCLGCFSSLTHFYLVKGLWRVQTLCANPTCALGDGVARLCVEKTLWSPLGTVISHGTLCFRMGEQKKTGKMKKFSLLTCHGFPALGFQVRRHLPPDQEKIVLCDHC